MNELCFARHAIDVGFERGAGRLVDQRADIGRKERRIADGQHVHRAGQHRDHAIGDIVLHEQHARRGTALAGAVESRCQYVGDKLFGQRARIRDRRILSPGLGDESSQ